VVPSVLSPSSLLGASDHRLFYLHLGELRSVLPAQSSPAFRCKQIVDHSEGSETWSRISPLPYRGGSNCSGRSIIGASSFRLLPACRRVFFLERSALFVRSNTPPLAPIIAEIRSLDLFTESVHHSGLEPPFSGVSIFPVLFNT